MTIDIVCSWSLSERLFTFTPMTRLARDWFEDRLSATGEIYKANQNDSMQITKRMLLDGMTINSEAETRQFRERFGIKESDIYMDTLPRVFPPIPEVPQYEDIDRHYMHGMGICE